MSNELEKVVSRIIVMPGRPPFMLDRDVAELYETETKAVNQAVKRNPERFPEDFYFQLTKGETDELVTKGHRFKVTDCDLENDFKVADCDLENDRRGTNIKYLPHAFTREGCNMLSAVLNTPVAIDRSILIIRAFSSMEKGMFRYPGDAPDSPLLPNGWQMHELRKIYNADGARRIMEDFFGISLDRFKYGIKPWEAQVIRKDNVNREHRNKLIHELYRRGVEVTLIATIAGFSKVSVYEIINAHERLAAIEEETKRPSVGDQGVSGV